VSGAPEDESEAGVGIQAPAEIRMVRQRDEVEAVKVGLMSRPQKGVTRHTDPNNRRATRVTLTPEGTTTAMAIYNNVTSQIHSRIAEIPKANDASYCPPSAP
jgi:hypothetical protein